MPEHSEAKARRPDGWDRLVKELGYEPTTFHDAEVVALALRTHGACVLSLFLPDFEQDYRGHEGLHVDFVLANVGTFEASGWAERNYVSRLHLVLDESGFSLQIEPTYGISLKLVAGSMKVEVTARGNRFVVRDVAT